jgi:hypothetical protein
MNLSKLLLLFSLSIFFHNSQAQELDVAFNVLNYNGGYNVSCKNASDGRIEAVIVGGTAPYSFQWSNGSFNKTITNIPFGTYTITVTKAIEYSHITF